MLQNWNVYIHWEETSTFKIEKTIKNGMFWTSFYTYALYCGSLHIYMSVKMYLTVAVDHSAFISFFISLDILKLLSSLINTSLPDT